MTFLFSSSLFVVPGVDLVIVFCVVICVVVFGVFLPQILVLVFSINGIQHFLILKKYSVLFSRHFFSLPACLLFQALI